MKLWTRIRRWISGLFADEDSPVELQLTPCCTAGTKVVVGGVDLTNHIYALDVEANVGDLTRVTLHCYASDGLEASLDDVDLELVVTEPGD